MKLVGLGAPPAELQAAGAVGGVISAGASSLGGAAIGGLVSGSWAGAGTGALLSGGLSGVLLGAMYATAGVPIPAIIVGGLGVGAVVWGGMRAAENF